MNENAAFIPNYGDRSLVFERGKGMYLEDLSGKRYLDFGAGIAVNILGHGDTELAQAIGQQAQKLIHTSNLYHNVPAIELSKRLLKVSGFEGVFFCNSGTEANEAALKFSRAFYFRKPKSSLNSGKKTKIISFQNGFHGRSFGSLSATSNEKYRTPFEPLVPDFEILPFNDIEAAEMKIDDSVAAVIVEPLQGEGGVRLANKGFLEKLRELTSRVDAILIFDEIQCGLGRLGDMFAFQKFDVMPDIVTLAKPLAGGLPMGAVLVNREVKASVQAGDHGSTFGANAVCAAASLCVFSKIESLRLTSNVVTLAPLFEKFLRDLVEEFPEFLVEERGAGFLRGIETRIPAKEIVTRAQSSGLLILSAGTHTLRFAPPLIASKEDFQSFQNIMHETLLQLQKEQRFL